MGKKGSHPFLGPLVPSSLGHRLDGGGQAALVPRSFVLVNDLLVGNRVEHFGRLAQYRAGGDFVAGFDRFLDAFDGAAQLRALARIEHAAFFALTCGFSSGCYIGQIDFLKPGVKKAAMIRAIRAHSKKNHPPV